MRSGIILIKEPKLRLADDLVLKTLEAYNTAVSYASPQAAPSGNSVHNAAFDPTETDEDGQAIDLLDAVEQVQKEYIDDKVFFHFSKVDDLEKEFSYESLQPFNIITEGEKTLVSLMLEGEFGQFAVEDAHTPEYHTVEDLLAERFTSIYRKVAGNLDAFVTELNMPEFRAKMLPVLRPRGVVLAITAAGPAVAFSDNKLGQKYSFGFATKDVGYVEPIPDKQPDVEPAAAPPPEPKPLSLKEKAMRAEAIKVAAATAAGLPAETPVTKAGKTSVPVIASTEPIQQPPKDDRFYMMEGVLYCRPPKDKTGKFDWKTAKTFWHTHSSLTRPKEPEKVFVGFPAATLKVDSPLMEMRKLMEGGMGGTAFRDKMQAAEANRSQPKIASAEVDKITIQPMIVPAEERLTNLQLIKTIPEGTMEQLMATQKEFRKFSEQHDTPFYKLGCAPRAWFNGLGKLSLILLLNEALMELYKAKPALFKAPAIEPAKVEEPVKPTEVEKPIEATPAQPPKQLSLKEKAALRAKAA